MGMTEKAQELEIWQREQAIEKAQRAAADLPGPNKCVKCQGPNDRRDEGYATCTCCVGGGR